MSAAEYWENRYRENGRTWSGRANPTLVREVTGLRPGTALDLGSGEGGDALWLAHNGWIVTAVDIAPTALAVGAADARPGDAVTWIAADLADWLPPTSYDLVTSHFLHSTVELPREAILRRGAAAVAPGGVLLVVGHAGVPHWAHAGHAGVEMPEPDDMLAALRLDDGEWTVVTKELVAREDGPASAGGGPMRDSVLTLRRAPLDSATVG